MARRRPSVSLVVARAANGVIGRNNELPWRLSADLKRFKSLTLGKRILMGRRTFESIGRALPGRTNIVLTRDPAWHAPGAITVHTLDEAFEQAGDVPELMVIGGAELFRLVMPLAERAYLTEVHAEVSGDIVFPALNAHEWRELEQLSHPADERNEYAMTFRTLRREAS